MSKNPYLGILYLGLDLNTLHYEHINNVGQTTHTHSISALDSLEWMALIRLLDGLQDSPVCPEGERHGQQGQSGVGQDTDDAAVEEGEQEEEAGAGH